MEIELNFSSKSPLSLHPKTSKFVLEIISGPSYLFVIKATSRVPRVAFNTHSLDFGPIFVMKNSIKRVLNLEIINHESKTMNIETTFIKTPFLEVQMSPGEILLPNKTKKAISQRKKLKFRSNKKRGNSKRKSKLKLPQIRTISNRNLINKNKTPVKNQLEIKRIPIVFSPRDVKKYKEKITFIINNNHEIHVEIRGEGCRFLLDVVFPEDFVDFGSVLVGKEVLRKFILKNNSKRMIPLDFNVKDQLKDIQSMGIVLSPDKPQTLVPKEEKTFYLRFKPKKRLTAIKTSLLLSLIHI